MAISTHIRCPACQGALLPTQLHCGACDLTLTGKFPSNEFASLGEEDLHFLRIFVLTEGRIRDMESALGVSYPTIKSRMAHLKATLAAQSPEAPAAAAPTVPPPVARPEVAGPEAEEPAALKVLQDLQSNRLTFEQAMVRLKALKDLKGEKT
jgi:hypothetical protein